MFAGLLTCEGAASARCIPRVTLISEQLSLAKQSLQCCLPESALHAAPATSGFGCTEALKSVARKRSRWGSRVGPHAIAAADSAPAAAMATRACGLPAKEQMYICYITEVVEVRIQGGTACDCQHARRICGDLCVRAAISSIFASIAAHYKDSRSASWGIAGVSCRAIAEGRTRQPSTAL